MTSDHLPQFIETNITENHTDLKISGWTWNLLRKCKAATETNPTTNNPFNIGELPSEYVVRKKDQVEEMKKLIQGKDFMLVQEADLLTLNHPGANYDKKGALITKIGELEQLGISYISALNMPTQGGVAKNMDLGILYNKNTLHLIPSSQELLFPLNKDNSTTEYRALACKFKILKDAHGKDISKQNHTVTLVSMHLDFKTDYSQDISMLEFLKAQKEAGTFVILGGDANHPSGDNGMPFKITIPMVHQNEATTFDTKDKAQLDAAMEVSHTPVSLWHNGDNTKGKTYDGFYVMPPLVEYEAGIYLFNNDDILNQPFQYGISSYFLSGHGSDLE